MHLEEGEMICDKCEGTGIMIRVRKPVGEISTGTICRKCHGTGKVDWIENIMGKKVLSSSSSSSSSDSSSSSVPELSCFFDSSMIEKMSKHISDEIDKEVLENCIAVAEQSNKLMKVAKSVLSDMGEPL